MHQNHIRCYTFWLPTSSIQDILSYWVEGAPRSKTLVLHMPYVYGSHGSDANMHYTEHALDCFDLPTHWATNLLIADHVTYTANDIHQMQSCDCTLNVELSVQ